MSTQVVSTAIIACLLVAITAPAFAADAPETKSRVHEDDGHEVGFQDQNLREEV